MDGSDRLRGRLAKIAEHSAELIEIVDRSHRWIFVNEAMAQACGAPARELLGKSHAALGLGDALIARVRALHQEVFESGEERRHTFTLPNPEGGASRRFEARLVPLVEADGRIGALISYGREVTGERALARKLEETQRLESLGLLAGGIAHDFNNLLTSILGTAAVARRSKDRSAIDEALAQIEASCIQAAGLCRQMLAHAGRERSAREPLDLAEVLAKTHELIAPSLPADLTFVFDIEADLPTVVGDQAQLQQVLMNLLLNAAEASEGHGQVRVRARQVDGASVDWSDARVRPERADGALVMLTVEDRGRGMDEETLSRIFEPFFTTKASGRGLGLAATLGILESHGAGVAVQSAPGEGTRFRLSFEASGACSRPAPAAPKPARTPQRILVVDDERGVRRVIAGMCSSLGHEVVSCASAAEALAADEIADPPFDLVVLDLTMPRMGGTKTLERLRATRPSLPAILMSGYSEPEIAERVRAPATAFLQKPFRFGDLERALAEVLNAEGSVGE